MDVFKRRCHGEHGATQRRDCLYSKDDATESTVLHSEEIVFIQKTMPRRARWYTAKRLSLFKRRCHGEHGGTQRRDCLYSFIYYHGGYFYFQMI